MLSMKSGQAQPAKRGAVATTRASLARSRVPSVPPHLQLGEAILCRSQISELRFHTQLLWPFCCNYRQYRLLRAMLSGSRARHAPFQPFAFIFQPFEILNYPLQNLNYPLQKLEYPLQFRSQPRRLPLPTTASTQAGCIRSLAPNARLCRRGPWWCGHW